MTNAQWQQGSFLDNFNTAANYLGYEYLPIAWTLAKIRWKSPSDRDSFLRALTQAKPGAS